MSLRARLQSGKILVAPGAYDALTARLLEQAAKGEQLDKARQAVNQIEQLYRRVELPDFAAAQAP